MILAVEVKLCNGFDRHTCFYRTVKNYTVCDLSFPLTDVVARFGYSHSSKKTTRMPDAGCK